MSNLPRHYSGIISHRGVADVAIACGSPSRQFVRLLAKYLNCYPWLQFSHWSFSGRTIGAPAQEVSGMLIVQHIWTEEFYSVGITG